MRIHADQIRNGSCDGHNLYICDYRQENGKKPIRNVPPTLAMVVPATEAKKTVYYSQSFFKPYGTTGSLISKEIMLFDNTGFRSFAGTPLNVFTEYGECVAYWNKTIDEYIKKWEDEKLVALQKIDNTINNFKGMIVEL